MKGLFKKAELSKKGYWKPINQDPSEWPKEVLSTFLDEFPEFTSQELHINFARKEPEKGYAIGAITIGKTTDLAVPVVINQFKLADMDVIVAQGRILPLTRENIFTLFSNRTAFANLTPSDQSGMFIPLFDNALRAANGLPGPAGTYSSGTAKTANLNELDVISHSFIDTISDSVTESAKQEILSIIKSASLKEKFEENNTYDIISKIESLVPNTDINIKTALSHSLPRDVHYIYQTGHDSYVGVFGNSDVYDPQFVKLSSADVENFNKIELKSVKKLENNEKTTKFAEFKVKNSQDRVLINHYGDYIELDASQRPSFSEKISEMVTLKGSTPESGRKYVLKLGSECLSPMQVQNVRYYDKHACVTVYDGLQTKKLYVTAGIKDIFPHDTEKNAFYIPKTAEFIEIHEKYKRKFSQPIHLDSITKLADDFYSLKGPSFKKFAKSTNQSIETLNFHDTIWTLIQTGADERDLRKVASLKKDETFDLDYTLRIPVSIDQCANEYQHEYTEKIASVTDDDITTTELVKLASEMKDKTTVDAILSLGFMNQDNISEFVQQLPIFEQVLSSLAKLLLMIRLGLNMMSEDPVQQALRHLVRVIERLRGVGKLNKVL